MTVLTDQKSVTRETASIYRRRALVVKLLPRHVEIREKGRRDVLSVDYLTLFDFAQKMRWRKEQAEKKATRGATRRKR